MSLYLAARVLSAHFLFVEVSHVHLFLLTAAANMALLLALCRIQLEEVCLAVSSP